MPYKNMIDVNRKCYWNEFADFHGVKIVAPNGICDVYLFKDIKVYKKSRNMDEIKQAIILNLARYLLVR